MAKPVLERLQFAGMVGVWSVAVVALVQLAAILVLIVLPPSVDVAIREPLRLIVASGAVAIMGILVALYFAVIRPNSREWKRLVARADERRQRFSAIFDEHPDSIAVYNIDGTIKRGNPAALRLLEYGDALIGKTWESHVALSQREEVARHFQYACRGNVAKFETYFLTAAGVEVPVNCYLVPTIVHGTIISVVGTARDLRDIKRAEAKAQLQSDRIAALARLNSDYAAHPRDQIQHLLEFIAASLDLDHGAVSFVDGTKLTVAYSATQEVRVGLTLDMINTFARHTYGSREVLAIADSTTESWQNDLAVKSQGWGAYIGMTIFVEKKAFGILSFTSRSPRSSDFEPADADFMRIAAALIGSSLERIRNERELAELAHIDQVTAIPNRAAFEAQLRAAIARAKRQGGNVRVHFVDLDGFKAVNDSLGHAAGDEVLRIVAARFHALLREEDMVARLGGDEFVVLESTVMDESDSTALGNRLVAAASEMMYVGGRIVRIGASVGVAAYPRHARDEVALLACADSAMYSAKTAGKGAVKLYSYG